jgi:hypothetical protein
MISEQRANELSDTPKIIDEDWAWEYKEQKDKYEAKASVKCIKENTTLKLVGWINSRMSYSYSLIHRGSVPIRRWGDHPGHKNPDNSPVDGPHKHQWREDIGTGYAYATDDVSTSSVDEAFFDFCDEESIEFNGTHYRFQNSHIDDWV